MMHPSGMTQQRWEWPFKTPEERKLVIAYFKRLQKETKQKELDKVGEALL